MNAPNEVSSCFPFSVRPKPQLADAQDLQSSFQLESGWQERLQYQVKADCALLEACQVWITHLVCEHE